MRVVENLEVRAGGAVYLIDCDARGCVDVYHTILGGACSGSYAGAGKCAMGLLMPVPGHTLPREAWEAIAATLGCELGPELPGA